MNAKLVMWAAPSRFLVVRILALLLGMLCLNAQEPNVSRSAPAGSSIPKKSKFVIPQVIEQIRPEYPMSMRASGLRGSVLVDFIVDDEGRVTNAYVVRSLNPAFNEPALEAVREWKFSPALKDGVPVAAHLQVPIIFQLQNEFDGGRSGFAIEKAADQAKLPPEFRYDAAPELVASVRPVYPYELLRAGVKGEATVRFVISESGRVIFTKVIQASRPEFGAAATAMIEQWEFEPAKRDSRQTRSVLTFTQDFSPDDRSVVADESDELLTIERKHADHIVSPGTLDEHPKPISMRPPNFPRSVAGTLLKGRAVVEVLIDEDGRARLPRVISASDPAFGWAAVQAADTWCFDIPRRGGKKVITRVRIPFEFSDTLNGPQKGKS